MKNLTMPLCVLVCALAFTLPASAQSSGQIVCGISHTDVNGDVICDEWQTTGISHTDAPTDDAPVAAMAGVAIAIFAIAG